MAEEKDVVEFIEQRGSGKDVHKYYFVRAKTVDEAERIAKAYKKPVPQRFERWTVVYACEEGAVVPVHNKSYRAPDSGYIMKFYSGGLGS